MREANGTSERMKTFNQDRSVMLEREALSHFLCVVSLCCS